MSQSSISTIGTVSVNNNVRSRGWIFTLNNYVEEDIQLYVNTNPTYYVIGREVGANGTPHLQGYIYFAGKKSLTQLRAVCPRAHYEVAKGTAQQNYVYCTKEGNFVEGGVMPATQAEKGLRGAAATKVLWDLAKAGDFQSLPPQNIKTWEYIHAKYRPPPAQLVTLQNLWIHGPSGSGKSLGVRTKHSVFYSKGMNKWWDGYNHEDVVLIDDFDPSHGKFLGYFLKIWGDHYPFNAEIKGGMLCIRPKIVIVTSQYRILDCFEDAECIAAVTRRFPEVSINAFNAM